MIAQNSQMNRAELVLKIAYWSAITLAAILKTDVSPVVSFPPSFARTFSSKETRLGTRQILCTNSQTLYKEGLERLRRRQSQQTLQSLWDRLLFYIENTIDTHGSSFYPGCKAIAIKNFLRPPITFRVSNQMNPS